ncbi:MAG: hydroxymyristoyl-ACP dehydratase [Flavobacteriaceae bacterium]
MFIINDIIKKLPYKDPFLFVDRINMVNNNAIEGCYTFKEEEFFYRGHFKGQPVTPGVILTECCAQIGLVCLGVYLLHKEEMETAGFQVALSGSEMQFFLPVLPLEMVTVKSNKLFFRFNKLKCEVRMYNQKAQLVCKGVLSGMIRNANI